MFDVVTCAITNLFRIYLVYRFVLLFLEPTEVSKKKEFLAYACYYVVNTWLFLEFHIAWVNVLSNLIGIGIVVWLRSKEIKTIVFVTITIYIINMACDVIGTVLFINYQDGILHSQVCAIIALFFTFICEFIAEKIVTVQKKVENIPKVALVVIPVCSILVICFLIYSDYCTDKGIVIVSIGLLIMNFFMLYLYNQLLKFVVQKYEAEVLKQKVEFYSNQLETILQTDEKVKTLRHDMKHHMNEIKLLANKYDVKEIQNYIDKMNAFIENPKEIVSSGNIEIDSVLNYMLQKAREELDIVNVEVMLPENIKHSFDINVLLGNLLENAIDAAKLTEKKYLNVDIALKKGVLKVFIENSCLSTELIKNKEGNVYLSTKKAKRGHGIGLKSVGKIVENYNGTMDIVEQDDVFCVRLILYMSKMENEI